MIPESIRRKIEHRLQQIAQEKQVRVLYAVESGSRAWGFPSADSDYDVRFVYVHPPDWYLSINVEHKRDVIEQPISDQLDLSGWDLRKALRLFRKSNPPLLEWLQSPIVYHEMPGVVARWRAFLPVFYSPRSALYHYLHMARGNFRAYLQREEVRVKKYFYVLRPLLAVRWIEASRGAVPVEFEKLVAAEAPSDAVRQAILDLMEAKKSGAELDKGPRIPALSDFIESEMERLEQEVKDVPGTEAPLEPLNTFFRETLAAVWPETPAPPFR